MQAMDERLEDFAGLLRQNGLRVSPSEVSDAAQATLLVGLEDRDSFRGALRATAPKTRPQTMSRSAVPRNRLCQPKRAATNGPRKTAADWPSSPRP